MPKWSKDATEFTVNVFHSDDKGSQVRIPKPLLERMGNPDKIKFVTEGKEIKLVSANNVVSRNTITSKNIKEQKVKGSKVKS